MRNKQSGTDEKNESHGTLGLLCLVATFLLPLGMIFVFIRLLGTWGAPVWYLCLHGIITAGLIMQVVMFFRMGLIQAIHNQRAGRCREGRNE